MQKLYGWYPNGLWGTDPLYMLDGSGTYFYHNDHLGTPQRLTDATTGAVVWSAGYAAFGAATIDPLSTVENNLRFPGQYFDAETGLHFNFNRYYDPATGRYQSTDPYGDGLNLYAYGYGNPVNLYDPLGLFSICDAHNMLDAAGMIPVIGEVFDIANAGLYFFRGKYGMAALSGGAAIPVAGYLFNAIKHSGRLGKAWKTLKKLIGNERGSFSFEKINKEIGDLFKSGNKPKATDLKQFAEKQGWKAEQAANGPLKYFDSNGVNRMTIKKGSSRAPGSNMSHVELRNSSGQRVNKHGDPVTRKSSGNHTPIDFDL
jgi:RHS repeat-associated protein